MSKGVIFKSLVTQCTMCKRSVGAIIMQAECACHDNTEPYMPGIGEMRPAHWVTSIFTFRPVAVRC